MLIIAGGSPNGSSNIANSSPNSPPITYVNSPTFPGVTRVRVMSQLIFRKTPIMIGCLMSRTILHCDALRRNWTMSLFDVPRHRLDGNNIRFPSIELPPTCGPPFDVRPLEHLDDSQIFTARSRISDEFPSMQSASFYSLRSSMLSSGSSAASS